MKRPPLTKSDQTRRQHRFTCPTCKRPLTIPAGGTPHRSGAFPFCSQRCKLVDLGAWLDAEYRIPARPDEESEDALVDESGSAETVT